MENSKTSIICKPLSDVQAPDRGLWIPGTPLCGAPE